MNKQFSKALYDECDKQGKDAVLDFLKQFNYTLISDKEEYSIRDLLMAKGDKQISIEVEISKTWTTDSWPSYYRMTCPKRKEKSKADLYIRTNKNKTVFIVVPMKHVQLSPIIIKDTIYQKNEPFFDCDIGSCDFHLPDKQTNNRYL